MDKIDSFSGQYRFLSNFHPSPLYHDGILYPTVEHAYQACKTISFASRWTISKLPTPGAAKKAGKGLVLRPNWDTVRNHVMAELVQAKFTAHRDLARLLIKTGDAELIEGNAWGDTYWGVCQGVGENKLGQILMGVRDSLIELIEDNIRPEPAYAQSMFRMDDAQGKALVRNMLVEIMGPHNNKCGHPHCPTNGYDDIPF